MMRKRNRLAQLLVLIFIAFFIVNAGRAIAADASKLYGIHWWGWAGSTPVDTQPASLLDSVAQSAWDLETIVTESDAWWRAAYFSGLYQDLYQNKNVTIITRLDYNWGTTVPPTGVSAWADKVVSDVVNVLKDYCHIWIIGNEMNIIGEGTGFPDSKIQPADYVNVYKTVRQRIHDNAQVGAPGSHIVLLGPVSPGAVIPGTRWMSGNDYLKGMLELLDPEDVDGFAIHSYGWTESEFHGTYEGQLALIDGYGFYDEPIYMTEWNRYTDPANPSQEAITADFIRDAFTDVNTWNQGAGHHNIICMTWFVYDADNQAGGGWNGYAIEYWKDTNYAYGDSRDIYTAFEQAVDMRYAAGAVGGGSPPAGSLPYVEEFSGATLPSYFNVHNPDDPSVTGEDSVGVSEGYLHINSNGYDDNLWTQRNAAPFVYLTSPSGDLSASQAGWEVQTWLAVDGGIPENHKAGIFITNNLNSTDNSIIFTMQRSSDWDTGVISSAFVGGTHVWMGYEASASLSANGLRVVRQGNQYSVYYRPAPSANWILLPEGGLFQPQNPVTHNSLGGEVYVGLFMGASPNNNGTATTAKYDCFATSWNPSRTGVANWTIYQ